MNKLVPPSSRSATNLTFGSVGRRAPLRLPSCLLALLTGSALLVTAGSARAASATFDPTPNSDQFSDGNDWSTGTSPGTSGFTGSTDIATFNATDTTAFGTAADPLLIDANRNIGGITFDTAAASAYVIGTTGGNALLLTTGGAINMTASVTSIETVNAPLTLEPASGTTAASYTISNNATSAAAVLNIGGAITLGTTTAADTLTFGGTNTGANTFSGTLSDTGSGGLNLNFSGAGSWTYGGTGVSTLAKGTIVISNSIFNFGAAGSGNSPTLTTTNSISGGGTGLSVTGLKGVFNMVNGSLNIGDGTYGFLFSGSGTNSQGGANGQTFNQTGGSISTNGLIGFSDGGGNTTVNVSGGTLTSTRGDSGGANGVALATRGFTTATLSGTGTITTPTFNMTTSQIGAGVNSTGGSVFNLGNGTIGNGTTTGGILVANQVIAGTGSAGTTFNFNGGTLRASASTATFLGTTTQAATSGFLSNAFVKVGGAIIDTQAFNDTITQPLLHDSTLGATADGGLTKLGAGTLTLGGVETYTGATVISAGTLQIGAGGTTESLSTSSTITDNGTLAFNRTNTVTQGTDFSGAGITGSGGLTQNGTGTVVLNAANNYAGKTAVTAGTLQFAKEVSLYNNTPASWTAANITVNSGGTVAFNVGGTGEFTNGDVTTLLTNTDRAVTSNGLLSGSFIGFDTTNAAGGTFTIPDVIANTTGTGGGTVGLAKLGANTLILSGLETYTGNTSIAGGALTIGGVGSLGSGSYAGMISNGGTFNYNSSATQTLSGVISGSGALNQNGLGVLTLSNADTYSGATSVNGTVSIGSTGALNSGGSPNFGGTFNLTGSLPNTSGLTVSNSGTFIDGNAATAASNNGVTNRINSAAPLTLSGGIFTMAAPAASNTSSQTLASLALGAGESTINESAATGTVNLTFSGASSSVYTRSLGSALNVVTGAGYNVSFTNAPTGAGNVVGSSPILIGATLNGSDFIAAQAGVLTSPTYTANTASALTAGANVNVTTSTTGLTGTQAINSLRFADSTARTVALTSGTLDIASGDILVGAAAPSGVSAAVSAITGGSLTSDSGELILQQANPADLRTKVGFLISSQIVDPNGSTKLNLNIAGTNGNVGGVLLNNSANSFTGNIYLNNGALEIGTSDGSLGAAGNTVIVNSGPSNAIDSQITTWSANHGLQINQGATVDLAAQNGTNAGTLTFNGALSGSGVLDIGGAPNLYNNGGLVIMSTNQNAFTGTYLVGTQLRANDGVGLSSNANLELTSSNQNIGASGVLETSANFSRSLGTGAGQVQFSSITGNFYGGGFSAVGTAGSNPVTVSLGGSSTPTALTIGSGGFFNTVSGQGTTPVLYLQDSNANNVLTFANSINNNNKTLEVNTSPLSAAASTEAIMSGILSGTGGFAKQSINGSKGLLVLTGNNTYTGITSIQDGPLSVSSLNHIAAGSLGGSNTPAASSSLGAPTTAANGTIYVGSTTLTGTLVYTGTGETTDRVINMAGTTGGATIDQSGSGALVFSSALTAGGVGAKTLTLQGSTAGTGQLSGAIVDSSGGATSVLKQGTGTWTLSGANTYTGTTAVNGGALLVNGTNGSVGTPSGGGDGRERGYPGRERNTDNYRRRHDHWYGSSRGDPRRHDRCTHAQYDQRRDDHR